MRDSNPRALSDAFFSKEADLAALTTFRYMVVEEVRFELTGPFGPTVFKTVALNRSAILPLFYCVTH